MCNLGVLSLSRGHAYLGLEVMRERVSVDKKIRLACTGHSVSRIRGFMVSVVMSRSIDCGSDDGSTIR